MDGGERAVIFDRFRGILPEVVGEGTHFRVPWVQTPHIMDIRTRPRTISSVTGTKGAPPAAATAAAAAPEAQQRPGAAAHVASSGCAARAQCCKLSCLC